MSGHVLPLIICMFMFENRFEHDMELELTKICSRSYSEKLLLTLFLTFKMKKKSREFIIN